MVAQGGSAEVEAKKLRQVVIASAAGTVFEWYDFFVYGALATIIAGRFFATLPESQAFVFTLLTFAAGFVVRPIGAIVFGKLGDSRGRKGAFLITISMMGLATFAIGLIPDYDAIGVWAPALLIACRVLQGFALGGEYGGAAIYVAEHAPRGQRGLQTSWIQASAAIGLIGALGVVQLTRAAFGPEALAQWAWRIPFLLSLALLGLSLWIRVKLEESPVFQAMKAEGRTSQNALAESFLRWEHMKFVLIALFGVMMAQGVVWYTGHFYAQYFLERFPKLPGATVNTIMMLVVAASAPMYIFWGWLSDRVGRKPVMLFGMLLMLAAYFPGFHLLTRAANPAYAQALQEVPVVVEADPADCSLLLDVLGTAVFDSSCDVARVALADRGVSYRQAEGAAGASALVRIGDQAPITAPDAAGQSRRAVKAVQKAFGEQLAGPLQQAGYPAGAELGAVNAPMILLVLLVFIIAATALYGPIAATLVELFPTRIRYTAMSAPYHIGTGWFGGLLPAVVFAINGATGDLYAGLWFPAIVTGVAIAVNLALVPETRGRPLT
jgi:MFS family permease